MSTLGFVLAIIAVLGIAVAIVWGAFAIAAPLGWLAIFVMLFVVGFVIWMMGTPPLPKDGSG